MNREPAETVAISSGVKVTLARVRRADGSDIVVYALEDPEQRMARPSIVLLHGSGADSVFPQSERGTSVPLLFGALCEMRDRWNVYLVEKRGIQFGQCAPPGGAENAGREYLEGESYEGRVADVCAVLDELAAERAGEGLPFVVIGSSEGSGVAAGVAARHCAPTHIALLPFSACHGLADSLTGLRDELARGEITAEEFQEQYDWLVETFRDVLGESRDALDRYLWGHSYLRWSSYCSGQVMADLLKVDIPVFLGIPSLDQCEGVDLAVEEFVRCGKKNLTYRNYINYDHGFFEHVGDRVECRHAEVLADILEWVRRS
ncbi:MAG: alpha/beta hydrolase [Gemmatimonadetes bacterium]|jgi:pimeloyl-ACP methyl ester carboxylesterase|nr:alpha/beta hydrolase [Gemmatimonadota bacterium]